MPQWESEWQDYYEILQVHPKATNAIIEKAYRELMKSHHPDAGGDGKFAKLLNEAREVLTDKRLRSKYDAAYGLRTGGGTGTASVVDMADQVLEELERRQREAERQQEEAERQQREAAARQREAVAREARKRQEAAQKIRQKKAEDDRRQANQEKLRQQRLERELREVNERIGLYIAQAENAPKMVLLAVVAMVLGPFFVTWVALAAESGGAWFLGVLLCLVLPIPIASAIIDRRIVHCAKMISAIESQLSREQREIVSKVYGNRIVKMRERVSRA